MIIDTSLAPSPIESVTHFPFALAKATTSAFYLGETLQQMTDEAIIPSMKKALADFLSLRAKERVFPSMITQILGEQKGTSSIFL
jgi:hypothetical protein